MPSFIDKLKDKADTVLHKSSSDLASDDSGDLIEHPAASSPLSGSTPSSATKSIFDTPSDPVVNVQPPTPAATMASPVAHPALAPAPAPASTAGPTVSADFTAANPAAAPAANTTPATGAPSTVAASAPLLTNPQRKSLDTDRASLAPSAAGSIKSSVLTQVDATPSPKNTQQQFQDAFPEISDDDILIEDYRCAYSSTILLQGFLFISEQRLAFSSNIIGYKTRIILPWGEIRSIEKRNTAKVIPNAIEITTTDGTSYLFTSLLSRDHTYDLIEALWTHHQHHPGDATATLATAADADAGAAKDTDTASAISYEDEHGERRRHRFLSGFKSGLKLPLRKNIEQTEVGGPTEAEKVKEAAMDRASESANIHPATHYEGSEFKNVALDVVLPTSPEKAFKLFFKDEAFLRPFLEGKEELREVNIGAWMGKAREMDYIKPLHASVGPKQTHCQIADEVVEEDAEKYFVIDTTTRTEDVPSGKDFSVVTRTVMEWAEEGGTHIKVTTEVNWTKVNRFLRGIIERSAVDGQVGYHKDLCLAVREHIEANPNDYAVQGVKGTIGPVSDTQQKLGTAATGKTTTKVVETESPAGFDALLRAGPIAIALVVALFFLVVTNLFTLRAMRKQEAVHRSVVRAGRPEVVLEGVQGLLEQFEGAQRRQAGTQGAKDARLKGELEKVRRHIVELGAKVDVLAKEI